MTNIELIMYFGLMLGIGGNLVFLALFLRDKLRVRKNRLTAIATNSRKTRSTQRLILEQSKESNAWQISNLNSITLTLYFEGRPVPEFFTFKRI